MTEMKRVSDSSETIKYEEEINALVAWVDCKTVGFFSKSVKKSVKRGVRDLRARASHARGGCEARETLFSASFQTYCLTVRAYLKNTDCFAVYCIWFNSVVICQMWPEQKNEKSIDYYKS